MASSSTLQPPVPTKLQKMEVNFLDQEKECGHGSWGGYGGMPWHKPWMGGMDMDMKMHMMLSGMRCPVCGEMLLKPTKEELIAIMERRKKRLEAVVNHLDKEIEKLKASPEM